MPVQKLSRCFALGGIAIYWTLSSPTHITHLCICARWYYHLLETNLTNFIIKVIWSIVPWVAFCTLGGIATYWTLSSPTHITHLCICARWYYHLLETNLTNFIIKVIWYIVPWVAFCALGGIATYWTPKPTNLSPYLIKILKVIKMLIVLLTNRKD